MAHGLERGTYVHSVSFDESMTAIISDLACEKLVGMYSLTARGSGKQYE
jgi:hypothetical protein